MSRSGRNKNMFTDALARTMRTLMTSHFVGLLLKTMILTLIAFTLFLVLIFSGLKSVTFFETTTLEWLSDGLLTVGFGVIAWALLPALLPMIAAFFQESIANSIERMEYPDYMPPKMLAPWHWEMWESVKFALLVIGLNLLLFWTYFIPVFGQFTYFAVNGYLIGREFFETAAGRHIGRVEAKKLRRNHRLPAILAGIAIVGFTLVPIVQLAAPFIGVAIMVHLFHAMPKDSVDVLPPNNNP